MIRYQSERLILRDMTTQDAGFIQTLYNDPDCLRYIGDRQIDSADKALAYIAAMQASSIKQGYGLYVVCLNSDTQRAIGVCGLLQRDYLTYPDLGYALLPQHRHNGLAREAAEAALAYAHELQIARLGAIVKPDNSRSIALLQKLGFAYHSPVTLPDGERVSLYRRLLTAATDTAGAGANIKPCADC